MKCPNGRPGALPTDGAGVYALRTDEHTVTCFDRFGTTLGTIKQDGEITMEPTFENGCVRVMDKLYLPTGRGNLIKHEKWSIRFRCLFHLLCLVTSNETVIIEPVRQKTKKEEFPCS